MKLRKPECIVPKIMPKCIPFYNYGQGFGMFNLWDQSNTHDDSRAEFRNLDPGKEEEEPPPLRSRLRLRKRNRFSFFGRSHYPGLKE